MPYLWIILLCTLPYATALSLTSSVEEAGRHAACPGEEVVFTCSVRQAVLLEWNSDSFPDTNDPVRFTAGSNLTEQPISSGEFQAELTSLTNINGQFADMTSTLTVVANDTASLNGTVVNCTELTDFTEQGTTESRRLHTAAPPSPPRSPSHFLQSHTDDTATVSVRWEQPESDGWARIVQFSITVTSMTISVSGNNTTVVLPTPLPYNQEITVLITASNCAGVSSNAELNFTIVSCGDPDHPSRGAVEDFNSTLVGSEVFYHCNEGLVPEERMTATCGADGNWSPNPAELMCSEADSATESSVAVIAVVVPVVVIVAATAAAIVVVLGILYLKKYRRKYNPPQPQPITSNGSDHDLEMYSIVKEDIQDSKPTHLAGVSYDEVNLDSRGGPPPVFSYADVSLGSGGVVPPKADTVQYSSLLTSETAKPQEPVHPADKKLNIDSVLIQLREVHNHWYQLGEALGVPTSVLDDVSQLCTTPTDSMVEVIDLWLRGHTGQPTWREVADALREVNLTHLSRSIRQVYTTGTLPVVVDERAPLPLPNRKEDTPPPIPARGGDSPEMPNPPAVPVRSGDSPEMPRPPPKPTRGHRTRQRPPVPPKSGGLTTSDPSRRAPPRPPKQPPSEEAPPPRPPKKMAPSVVAAPPIPPKPTLK